ncbi:MAG: RNA-binding S4 domain-containing protein [Alphaproteobacteria bacterium]|jgi:ribosome-associated heat shock protein Hsp15|nr:RNA-binding S4 domain-containing protein [Rhizobiaceae bacterium]MBU3963436.1 RNA-binding S4 domain-containing protein [Alphaproteobacteria bacterium]MBU4051900.1 RNA-binding S4 domain-containing protein [Alphaproteobacteria bacterium]MBU4088682.1 RNA-binding S4 domain-containing protein [Alphaproteobacteria bacterium]MBU4157440.1 RNA-binding S4 domain-containing protein [Alphaproteobacteria bacterium]
MDDKRPQTGSRQRIDKWLFFARVSKSRSLAQERVAGGHVRINGQIVRQSSHLIGPGDRIEVALQKRDIVLLVVKAGERRGPYEEARLLYQDMTPPPSEEDKLGPLDQATRLPGSGRPTKKERRAIDRLQPGEPWSDD